MANLVLDVEGLAAYLHLDPASVQRLADRGKLPGRKVGGKWCFSESEIHHWLEERIGLSDDDELAKMESVLQRPPGSSELESISIAQMLPLEAIEIPLTSKTRNSIIDGMVEVAARTGWLWDPGQMAEAVKQREEMHPTALDNGVAFLHPRRPLPSILGEGFLALGITPAGIPFGHRRGLLTDVFFLICSIDDRPHLRTLARLSRLVSDTELLAELRAAQDSTAIHGLITDYEQELEE